MTYQDILNQYLEQRVYEDDAGSGTFEWEDESEEDFSYDLDELREEFIEEYREEYLEELASECEDEDCDDEDPDFDEEDLLERYDFMSWVSDKTGWSPEEIESGSRGVLYQLSASYETDENGYITDISDISKSALRGEDAASGDYDDVEPDGDDYDELESRLQDIITDEPWDSDEIDWEAYDGYPFAAEVVNGEILSMTEAFQQEVLAKLLAALEVTEQELAEFLTQLNDGEASDDERFALLADSEYDFLAELLGYDADEEAFSPAGIGFLESSYGFEAIDLLKQLGFPVEEDITPGTHGHGTDGVVYVE